MADKAKKQSVDDDVTVPKRGHKLLLMVLVFVGMILLAGGYTGAAWFLQWPPFEPQGPSVEEIAAAKAAEAEREAERNRDLYVKFNSPFTFNLSYNKRQHSAQVELVLVVSGAENEELAKKHLDLLSSTALQVLSAQSYQDLLQPTGREKLRLRLLDTLRGRMTEIAKNPVIEHVLFSDFVMQ